MEGFWLWPFWVKGDRTSHELTKTKRRHEAKLVSLDAVPYACGRFRLHPIGHGVSGVMIGRVLVP